MCVHANKLYVIESNGHCQGTGEFIIDPLPPSNPHSKAFTIDPLKSSVEAGTSKIVTITFHPPKDGSTRTFEIDTNVS